MENWKKRFEELEKNIYGYEDLIDFISWYAEKRGLTSIVDEFNEEVESDLQEQIDRLKWTWEAEVEQPTRNYYKYSIEAKEELEKQDSDYREAI